jgi:hypothetical protein
MLSRHGICPLSQHETDQLVRLQKINQETADILKRCPKPDTFLGRRTQEPFPKEICSLSGKSLREVGSLQKAAGKCLSTGHV